MLQSSFKHLKSRILIGVTLLVSILLGNLWLNSNGVVTVGIINWIGYEPVRLAQKSPQGSEKVLITPMNSSSDVKRALTAGTIDAGYLTLDEVISLQSEGVDVRVVLIANISAGADALMSKPEITSVKDLKGKRIAYEPYSIGELFFHKMLLDHQLSSNDVIAVTVESQEDHMDLWRQNSIDASVTFEPTLSKLKQLGATQLYDSRQMPNTIIDVLAVKQSFIEDHPAAVQRLVDQHLLGLQMLRRNLENSLYEIAAIQGASYDSLFQAIKGIILPSKDFNMTSLSHGAKTMKQTSQLIEKIMLESQTIANPINHDKLFTDEFFH